MYYSQDAVTGQQSSLRTTDRAEAITLLHSKNEAFRQPILNLQIARTYLSASDRDAAKRPRRVAMEETENEEPGRHYGDTFVQ